jgi:hypothetical protein
MRRIHFRLAAAAAKKAMVNARELEAAAKK